MSKMTTLPYSFVWNELEAKKFTDFYQQQWAARANQCIRDQVHTNIPTEYQQAALETNDQGETGKSFAQFIESAIPNPWDFDQHFVYAYSYNNRDWFQLLPLTPWVWLSQPQSTGDWLIFYGLNSELIRMLIEKQIDLNNLKVIRWPK